MAKVMVFTPTWVKGDGSLALRPETRAAVENFTFDGEIVWEVGLHNPFGYETHQNVLAQYVRGREVFLASGCDALLTVEHDMDVPRDGLQKLWEAVGGNGRRDGGAPGVAYGVYLLRHGSYVLNAWEYVGDRNLGESLSLMPDKLARARAAGTVRVSGCGFGCTLIRRAVLERFEFHKGDSDQWCPDIPFAIDVLQAGIASVARMDVACDHLDGGLRLSPYQGGAMDKVTVVANETVNIAVVTNTMHLEGGQEYRLPRDVASELQRAGYVRVTSEDLTVFSGPGEWKIIERETAALDGGEQAVMGRPRRKRGAMNRPTTNMNTDANTDTNTDKRRGGL